MIALYIYFNESILGKSVDPYCGSHFAPFAVWRHRSSPSTQYLLPLSCQNVKPVGIEILKP